jgi:tape measure domain-containing protein
MARNIEAFKLRTELIVDASKASSEYKKAEASVTHYGDTVKKVGKDASKAFDGQAVGKKWGSEFGGAAVSAITGSITSLGQTFGGLIGTAIAPGAGTAIGSIIGSGLDKALGAVSGPMMQLISQGIDLNKQLEETAFEFKTFAGNATDAKKYLDDLLVTAKQVGIMPQVLVDTSEKLFDLTGNLKSATTIMKAAADQAADFGGSVETFQKIADTLGLISEKGQLATKDLRALYKVGIDASKYLAEASGKTKQQVDQLIKAGRIRGDVAAQIISLGIEREKGGFAAARTGQTVAGAQRQFDVLSLVRATEATQNATQALGSFYKQADEILAGPTAIKVTDFINKFSGAVIDFTKSAVRTGTDAGSSIFEALINPDPSTAMQSLGKLANFTVAGLKEVFQIFSPSELVAGEIGEPLGEGLGVGMTRRFTGYIQGQGKKEILDTLEELLKDPRIAAFLELISKSETGKGMEASAGRLFGPLGSTANPGQFGSATAGWPGMRVKSPTLGRTVWTHPLGGLQIEPGTAATFSKAVGQNMPMDVHTQNLIGLFNILKTPGAVEAIKSGNVDKAIQLLGGIWESFKTYNKPGSAGAAKLAAGFESAIGGKPISATNPMPVYVPRDLQGGAALVNWQGYGGARRADAGVEAKLSFGGTAKAIMPPELATEVPIIASGFKDLSYTFKQLTPEMQDAQQRAALFGVGLPPAMKGVQDASTMTKTQLDDLTKQMNELWKSAVIGTGAMNQIAAAVGSISGMIPSATGQVSKKRSMFSKILGIAAPFLSFIPGVGPILSTIAGAASSAIGGNYGAAVSQVAGGFQQGGAFANALHSGAGGSAGDHEPAEGRAAGGTVTRGRRYLVGEYHPEVFIPGENGYVSAGAGGGSAMVGLLTRLHATLDRFDSMPADHVVMKGARGMLQAMDSNAALADGYGRRLRLA